MRGPINGARPKIGKRLKMSNNMYRKIHYIDWKKEGCIKVLQNDEMLELVKKVRATRQKASTKTKRTEFDELHYGLDVKGDYVSLYMYEDGKYMIYKNNMMDSTKNSSDNLRKIDYMFDYKFREFNGISIRKAYGFVDRTLKRCIPKQFYYINKSYIGKVVKASSIDASSQYPSGCLGRLPDMHTAILMKGKAKPTEEYPFAFYASGHCAEYGVFDTHDWMGHKFAPYLFRIDKTDPYPLRRLSDDEEETILMKASQYTMDETWRYFYNNKNNMPKGSEDYNLAKLIMNKTIGCWHRKDKDKKSIMTYDDNGSYKLAHIVAIAIARGNQKILDMIDNIGLNYVLHICVDGIIYMGFRKYGQDNPELGVFSQEFLNADFMMTGINVYCAKQKGKCVKFKHGGFDLLNGEEIDETKDFDFDDLYNLSAKEHVGDIIWEDQ